MYKKNMDAHKGIKRRNVEIELGKHIDLIEDENVK